MPDNKTTGKEGEQLAADFLRKKGYSIAHTNWKGHGCEIDIIARHKKTWIFVEVKTRMGSDFGWPEKAVNQTKRWHITKAANSFIAQNKIDDEIRFDIISITIRDTGIEIYHIEDAFR